MDSLTQFALGAAVSTAFLGSKIGPRKAVLIGGILGTIPDLDVLIPFETKIEEFVYHRGWSHSVFTHLIATPVLAEVLMRLFETLKSERHRVWAAVFFCLITHSIIDSMNAYGARILWPFHPDPIGVGSIFIIDPVFTVPLAVAVIWAAVSGAWSAGLNTVLISSFIFSTGYLVAGIFAQSHIHSRGQAIFADRGIEIKDVKTVVTPFNTLLWRVIGRGDGEYHNLYLSLFDRDDNAVIYTHKFDGSLISCVADDREYQKMIWFSDGFVRTDLINGKIVATDYRLGLTPTYIFQFAIAEYSDGQVKKIKPEPITPSVSDAGNDFNWLWNRVIGKPVIRASEKRLSERVRDGSILGCSKAATIAR